MIKLTRTSFTFFNFSAYKLKNNFYCRSPLLFFGLATSNKLKSCATLRLPTVFKLIFSDPYA